VRNKSVAVLDIRSSEICAVVGEKGVNNTFVIKSKYTCRYEGYAEGELLDIDSFNLAICDVVKSTLSAVGEKVKAFYVGVPCEFLKLEICDKVLSFPSPKKVSESDISALIASSEPNDVKGYRVIGQSPVYYVLSDKRRVIDPIGVYCDSLRAKLSFILCRTAFIGCVKAAFKKCAPLAEIYFLAANLAETNYLIEPEIRDSYAVLFDFGYISSSYSVSYGNGIVFSEAFSVGIGHIAVLLMNELDIPYEVAKAFLGKVNLNAKEKLSSIEEYKYRGQVYSFATSTLRDLIREGLDGICETIEECRQAYTGKDLSGKPLYVTGEGINAIRGAADHLSSRLVTQVEVISPKLPYYDKPQFSSIFSLLAAALGE
jgi:cell division ATPase FtsA